MNPPSLPNLLMSARSDFDECYEYGSEIGKGRYATVKKCYCKKTQKCFAAKVIKNFRTKNSKLNMNIVENEITALTMSRSNASIVNLHEVFYHRGETILILEYATEKDLHLYLDCEGAFEEEKAAHIIYQVLKAIEFLHSKQILHLDIKPENVLLMSPMSPGSDSSGSGNGVSSSCDEHDETSKQRKQQKQQQHSTNQATVDENHIKESSSSSLIDTTTCRNSKLEPIQVKLCDFSFSQIMQPGKHILGMMGTVAYSAPEVIQFEPLTKATDMWSLGVLTHVLLTEYTPFGNGTEKNMQTENNILSVREKEFKCSEEYFENISREAQDFIESLIKFKPKLRLTVEEALNHKWFQKYGIVPSTVDDTINETKTIESSSNVTKKPSGVTIEDETEVTKTKTVSKCTENLTKTTKTITEHRHHKRVSTTASNSSTKIEEQKATTNIPTLIDVVTTSSSTMSSPSASPVAADIKSSSTSSISSTGSFNPPTHDTHTATTVTAATTTITTDKILIRNKYSIDDDDDDDDDDDEDDDEDDERDLINRLSDCTLLTNGAQPAAATTTCLD